MFESLTVILKRAYHYFLLTVFTTTAILHFCYALALYPIGFISPDLFRQLISYQLWLTSPGFVCVFFSWAGCKMYASGLGRLKRWKDQDLLILANHSGRIDWLFGLYASRFYGQRVGYVTEAFIMYLPFGGWHRYLVEDMFVYRSFKRDRDRLLRNITSFKKSKVPRWVFLCPEGHIADFNAFDQNYIKQCQEFCKEQGLEPFKMCLTPRYKGMQCFRNLLPDGSDVCVSATMTYVQKGNTLVKPLDCKDRVIPDLWSCMTGGLECHAHLHDMRLGKDPLEIKSQLMKDYSLKDKLLQEFYETGKFPDAYPGLSVEDSPDEWKPLPDFDVPLKPKKNSTNAVEVNPSSNSPASEKQTEKIHIDYDVTQEIPAHHLAMNASFFGQIGFVVWVLNMMGLSSIIIPSFVSLYVLVVISHLVGESMANGQSRESVPFEGIFKAILFRFHGIEGNDQEEAVSTST